VGGGKTDAEADRLVEAGGAASLLAHYALAQAALGVAFMPDVGDSKAVAVKKKVSQPAGDLTSGS
jgi:hypothetical protein